MAHLDITYPAEGADVPLTATLDGPSPLEIDGDSASFLLSVTNPLDRIVDLVPDLTPAAVGTGALAGQLASVTLLRKNTAGSWVQAPTFGLNAGATMELRMDVTLVAPMAVGAVGGVRLAAVEA